MIIRCNTITYYTKIMEKSKNKNNKNNKNNKKQNKNTRNNLRRSLAPSRTTSDMQDANFSNQVSSILTKGYGKTLSLTPSVANFAKVYSDPFSVESARLPAFPLVPSQLTRTFCSGTGRCNNNGYGYIAATPIHGVVNDEIVATYSSGPAAPDAVTFVGIDIANANTNSEFTANQFESAAQNSAKAARIVSFGIRVRYTGTTLNAAGQVYMLQMTPRSPNASVENFTVDAIKRYPGYKEYSFTQNTWRSVCRQMQTSEDFFYQDQNTDLEAGWTYLSFGDAPVLSLDSKSNILAYISSGVAGTPFEWEIVGHYEVIGPNLNRKAISHSNTAGTEQVVNAFAQQRHKDSTTPDHAVGKEHGWLEILKKGAEQAIPMIPKLLGLLL
jgi:hypothetical protein